MPKPLSDFEGDRIYVESNIFLFIALGNFRLGPACMEFFGRAARGEFEVLTSSLTVDEVAFVALKVGLEEKFRVTSGAVAYLKRNPEIVKTLGSKVIEVVQRMAAMTRLVEVASDDVLGIGTCMEAYGLLPRDACHLSVMHRLGMMAIASNDRDFDRVPWLTRYYPQRSR